MQLKTFRLWVLIILIFFSFNTKTWAQCCGGGGGSPIAGGSSQGVLQENQVEINTNFQYIHTTKFFSGDKPDTNFLDSYSSSYSYTRLAYGLSKKLTISLETGYWLDKTEVGKNKSVTYKSSGIGDLIIFPRYNVFNIEKNHKKTELTVGIGFKIPLGSYNDSTKIVSSDPFLGSYFITKPLSVQTSSGSQDLIFYTFISRTYSLYDFRVFANALYVKKGWNPIGEKLGDYASVGIFAGKTFFKNLGVTFQVKGEWIAKMKLNETVLLNAYPNYDPLATGSKKVFFVPQISYNYKGFVIYALSEIPVYQYVTKIQIASQFQTTLGISYRFMAKKACAINPVIEVK
ncbi:MAG: hypothetical protein WCO13_05820 [Bacteroidota bacterium]